MRVNDGALLFGTAEISDQLDRLVDVEPGEALFVSCYLDMGVDRKQQVRFLDEQKLAWRDRLPDAVRQRFDESLQLVRAEVARRWHPAVNGLAVFTRGDQVSCVATAATLTNRFNVYNIPDVLPLFELLQSERRFALIMPEAAAPVEVTDVDAGLCTSYSLSAGVPNLGKMPVVVAGDDTGRRRVAAWVSERSHRGPVHELRVPDTFDKQTVVAQARQLMREHSQWHADGKARRITRAASKSLPDVVAGAAASRAMLRAGLVKTLLVVPDLVRTTGWHRASCDETVGALVAPANWSQRGDRMRASCQPLTELVRMASQRGVEVLVSTTDELRELGGVACLLAEPAERHLMPAPALVRPMGVAAR